MAGKGRPKLELERLTVSVPRTMIDAIDARIAGSKGIEAVDRGAVVRACLAKCLAAELKAGAAAKP
jgi:hypothetical protein